MTGLIIKSRLIHKSKKYGDHLEKLIEIGLKQKLLLSMTMANLMQFQLLSLEKSKK